MSDRLSTSFMLLSTSESGRHHLDAQDEVLPGEGLLVGDARDEVEQAVLPEGEEDDALDGEELEHGVEGLQDVPRGQVEDPEPVERERVRHVVDHDEHELVGERVVLAARQHEQRERGEEGLDEHELDGGALAEPQQAAVAPERLQAAAERPRVADVGLALHLEHAHGLAAGEAEHEREEAVDHEGLVAVADRVEVQRLVHAGQRQQRAQRVHGHHHEDAHDVALQLRPRVVRQVLHDVVRAQQRGGHAAAEGQQQTLGAVGLHPVEWQPQHLRVARGVAQQQTRLVDGVHGRVHGDGGGPGRGMKHDNGPRGGNWGSD
ncbi:unnamed protein product [Phytophthora fragariaefolia]|uniref:Unnamed protein product n=1 Tax=Phytophthora fragariaefolia TaxID=1490495 RepID=A0A9W6YQJ1_9STRA|nr:unnamed protein product [Phytophthora fragariaefolia]